MIQDLYAETAKRHPELIADLDKEVPNVLLRCPICGGPCLTFAVRWHLGVKELICPKDGVQVVPLGSPSGLQTG